MGRRLSRIGPLFKMIENLSDDGRLFYTGDHLDGAAVLLTVPLSFTHTYRNPKQNLKYLDLEGPGVAGSSHCRPSALIGQGRSFECTKKCRIQRPSLEAVQTFI